MRHDATRSRALPIMGERSGKVVGTAGVLVCTLCCLSIPGIAAALSALGLGFLRNDGILIPGMAIFAVIVIGALVRARRRHARWGPLVAALAAVVVAWIGLTITGSMLLVTLGDLALLGAVVWDATLQRRCAV